MLQPGEITVEWDAFKEGEKETIASCFAIKHGLKRSQVLELVAVFNITHPSIVLGSVNNQSYARLADTTQDSKDVLTLLIKNYVL